jgi:hypothetical protein
MTEPIPSPYGRPPSDARSKMSSTTSRLDQIAYLAQQELQNQASDASPPNNILRNAPMPGAPAALPSGAGIRRSSKSIRRLSAYRPLGQNAANLNASMPVPPIPSTVPVHTQAVTPPALVLMPEPTAPQRSSHPLPTPPQSTIQSTVTVQRAVSAATPRHTTVGVTASVRRHPSDGGVPPNSPNTAAFDQSGNVYSSLCAEHSQA